MLDRRVCVQAKGQASLGALGVYKVFLGNACSASGIDGVETAVGVYIGIRINRPQEFQAGQVSQGLDRGQDINALVIVIEDVFVGDIEHPTVGSTPKHVVIEGGTATDIRQGGGTNVAGPIIVIVNVAELIGLHTKYFPGAARSQIVLCAPAACAAWIVQQARGGRSAIPQRAVVADGRTNIITFHDDRCRQ